MIRWPAVLAVTAAAGALWLAWALYDTLFPIFLGFGLAYAFDPLADWLEKQKLGRTAAASLLLCGVGIAVLLAVALIVPALISEARDFALDFPRYASVVQDKLEAWLSPFGVRLPHDKQALLARLQGRLEGVSLSTLSPVGAFAGRFFSSVAGTITGLLNFVIVPVIFFYFLRDISEIRTAALSLVPPRLRGSFEARLDEADRVFSGYLRGQMTVALILAVIYSVGLSLTGIRFSILIGLVSGLLNIVPYLGVALGLGAALIMAFVDFAGWGPVLGVLAVFGCAQVLEGFFITPRIVGDKVGLGTVETIVALILGGEFGGMPGMILAIPAAGCLKAWANDAAALWRRSAYYR
jgi:predicted PurR-regulated permease PerM